MSITNEQLFKYSIFNLPLDTCFKIVYCHKLVFLVNLNNLWGNTVPTLSGDPISFIHKTL